MTFKFICCYASILVLLALPHQSFLSSNPNSFYSASEDVRYLVENIPVQMPKEFTGGPDFKLQSVMDESLYGSKVNLKFYPPILDFKERFLGIPHHEKVTIVNTSFNKTVHLSSISGNTIHFHSSFFQDKLIPPLGNTSFNIVFLGRGEGEIESNLYIHTSEGSFKYLVKGEGVVSPYRLRPISGVRLPLNASYSPLIVMHNPYASSLQLVEVYSSGGDFHLELPSGELEGPKQIWNIPAFLTKPIIRLKFHATSQKNYTAYIRLKVDNSDETLVIPVDVEVGPTCGLYSSDNLIDFGIGGTEDPPKQVKLFLRNSWRKPIRVQNVVAIPSSKALSIDFQPVKIPPDTNIPTQAAVLTFDWKAAHETGHSSGRVIVKSAQNGQKFVMTYSATVLDGGLHFNGSQTKFQSDSEDIYWRPITLTNNYKIPVAITNASLADAVQPFFEISDFSPTVIYPGQTENILFLNVKDGRLPHRLKLESTLTIFSNVSILPIPILCYDGKLIKVLPSDVNDTELYLGTVGSGSTQIVNFALINENPVAVQVKSLFINIAKSSVRVVAVEKGNYSVATLAISSDDYNMTLNEPYVGPGYFCVIQVLIPVSQETGRLQGDVTIETEYETIVIPLYMRIEHGSLSIITNPVEFLDCFPSAVCAAEVRAESNFSVGMAITSVASIPHHPRLGFIPVSPPLIPPQTNTFLGHITWDMSGVESYLSPHSPLPGTQRWLDTLTLPSHIREIDISLLTKHYEQYQNISSDRIELSLRLDTTEVRNLGFKAIIRPAWPSVIPIPTRTINFPLTQVETISYKQLTIINPASKQPVVIQLLLDSNYPLAQGVLNDLPLSLRPSINMSYGSVLNEMKDVFHVVINDDLPIPPGTQPHKKSVAFILKPLANATVTIAFKPEHADLSTSILLIRNNLTILEAVQLIGTGAYAQLKLGNRKPGSSMPLFFELLEKHAVECDRSQGSKSVGSPNLTVKRSFTARNTGALPLFIHVFAINGQYCQGFGFKVLNCQPYLIPPNSSKKIDIAFTPDFTLSKVTRTLTILTPDLAANYTLIATVPPFLLAACSAGIERPSWEPLLYYVIVSLMLVLLISVMAAAIFESNRILRNTIIALSRVQTVQPVLDLRMVGAEVNCSQDEPPQDVSTESPTKLIWNPNMNIDLEVPNEIQNSVENNALCTNNLNGKPPQNYPTTSNNNNNTNNANCNNNVPKKKTEKPVSKRTTDSVEVSGEKSEWESSFSRQTTSPAQKHTKSSGICITTEPYTPLANLKPRETNSKSENMVKSKSEPIQRNTETQQKKKKKTDDARKRTTENNANQSSNSTTSSSNSNHSSSGNNSNSNNTTNEDGDSSTTESSSNDDGDKDVESMFFRSVRNHLQNKVGKGRHIRFQETSPLTVKAKKTLEKCSSSSIENYCEAEEDDMLDKVTVVKGNRRPHTSAAKPLKKQVSNAGKSRHDQLPPKVKQNGMERGKIGSRRDKNHISKKRVEKFDKHAPLTKVTPVEALAPPPPPPPVWTTSFSDVVARSDSSYSSVVALKNNEQHSVPKQPPMNLSPVDNGFTYTQKDFPSEWKNEYPEIDQIKQNCSANHQLNDNFTGAVGTKLAINSVWDNWSTLADSIQSQNTMQQSVNSLFTHSQPRMTSNNYETLWNDPNVMKVLHDQQGMEYEAQQTFTNNEINWPSMPSLWEPLYTPSSTIESLPPVWGSDVWGPPTSPSPSPPDENINPHPMEYHPFRSLSNIWGQHSANIWKPPTTE
ncbi:transmembrane protein 131 [Cimex lectularius]|uniref:Transmembrane protein 131 n=1 Tax=Cimex lectularius TaxID=79782 RepID=A0A8I6TK21_CIMLE|nr:transmembrane protein 131 [Cimex lectularius]